jgi:hypothetical protein
VPQRRQFKPPRILLPAPYNASMAGRFGTTPVLRPKRNAHGHRVPCDRREIQCERTCQAHHGRPAGGRYIVLQKTGPHTGSPHRRGSVSTAATERLEVRSGRPLAGRRGYRKIVSNLPAGRVRTYKTHDGRPAGGRYVVLPAVGRCSEIAIVRGPHAMKTDAGRLSHP